MNSYFSAETRSTQNILESFQDEMLVAAAKTGEQQAFSELWNRHSKKTFSTTYRITRNRQDAEDALQDAFLKAYVHLKNFDGRSSFSTWLTRIAINSALMILRRKRAHPEISMDGGSDGETGQHCEVADKRVDTEEHYVKSERAQRLQRAIPQLRPALRTIVELQQVHDIPIKKIAEIAGISVAATKSRLSRARTVLRRSLA
jgi:RNA polymerase sigma factor (sigma-70 family)